MQIDENGLDCECKLVGEEWLPALFAFCFENTRKYLALGLLLTLCWDRVYTVTVSVGKIVAGRIVGGGDGCFE